MWRACGAIWLAASTSANTKDKGNGHDGADITREHGATKGKNKKQKDDGGTENEDEDEHDEEEGPVRRNLGPFLNVVEACLRAG